MTGMAQRSRARRRDAAWNPPSKGGDVTALFAALVAVPLLLPLVSKFGTVLYALPVIVMGVAAPRCIAAARRSSNPILWRVYAVAATLGAITASLAAAAVIDDRLTTVAFYFGSGASACFLLGLLPLARRNLLSASERLVDALLFDAVVVALGVWFIAVPGFRHGDAVLTAVFVVDLIAVALAAIPTLAAAARADRRTGWWLLGVCAGATVGDGYVAAGGSSAALTALCWTASSIALVGAATSRRDVEPECEDEHNAFVVARIVLPPLGVVAFPAAAAVLATRGELTSGGALYFAIFFVTTLVLAFGRQAYLLLDNRRAVIRERRLRGEMMRRNEELEAVTELAATLTETLEEDPVIERGLAALRLAARASSMALHLPASDDSGLVLHAAAGEWATDSPWVTRDAPHDWKPGIETAGGRQIIRLTVSARGHYIGLVTLVRRDDDPVTEAEMRLLRLLVAQVAIGVQNARDYRDRLEQAIRDPLTGLLNRRYLYEAFATELERSGRYGSSGSIVLIDVDDFKQVNDTLGHTAGDGVLCEIGRLALDSIRSADSFARVGGEEFALLLPETSQLDALIVAERVRRAVASAPILDDRTVTVSAGIATWPEDGSVLEELEGKADAALYWAKRNGKNLCAVATEVVVPEDGGERDSMLAHLHALVATIDSQHLNTRDHSQNVVAYAGAIGEHLGLSRERNVLLRRAALFHDIGKVAVRGEVLNKPSELTDEEFEEIKVHAVVGGAMLKHSGFEIESSWVRSHHERLDGRGYPDGLGGADVPLEARIIHVADSFEAMTSDRPYHRGIPVEDALAELRRCAGSQFDGRLVEALAELLEQDRLPLLALRDAA